MEDLETKELESELEMEELIMEGLELGLEELEVWRLGGWVEGGESTVADADGLVVVAELWGANNHPWPLGKQLEMGPSPR